MKQQLTLSFRAVLQGRYYSLLSVLGLAVAMAVTLLITLLIHNETDYDKDFVKADSLYRITWESTGTGDRFATAFNPISPQLKQDYDTVLDTARLGLFELTLQAVDRPGSEVRYESVSLADPSFFHLFDFKFVAGGPDALDQPNSLVISRAAAEQYFPGEDAMGQTLLLENQLILKVTAVLEDIPPNTHLTSHFFIPLETLRSLFDGAAFLDNWGSDLLYHYIELAPGADSLQLERQLPAFLERHDPEWPLGSVEFRLQPLKDIHFTTDLQSDMPVQDRVNHVSKAPRRASDLVLFSAGAIFMILVACFNFMNLLIARSVGRGRQVGLLKVVGANRRQVLQHILAESLIMSSLALIVAAVLVDFSLPSFNELLGLSLDGAWLWSPVPVGISVTLALVLGLVSGLYPALLMASQKPSAVMKGEFSLGQGATVTRSALVLLQFTVSVLLIVICMVIYAQIQFSLSVPLGFRPDGVAVIQMNSRTREHYDALRERLMLEPVVQHISLASTIPTDDLSSGSSLATEDGEAQLDMRMVVADYDYFETLGIDMVSGRAYSRDFSGDEFRFPTPERPHFEGSIIINEAAARRAGWTSKAGSDAAIGQTLSTRHEIDGVEMTMRYTVVGVARDVHFRSLRSEIVPMQFLLSKWGNSMIVRFAENTEASEAQGVMQAAWDGVVPSVPLRFSWLRDSVTELYKQEYRALNLVASLALLSIAVACLGLFAVAALITGLRSKEMGIRKILGAGVRELVGLLSWQFVKPVLLANLLAWPLAWIYLSDWLQNFAYRVELGWNHFLIPAFLAVSVALITVAARAWWVARANPIQVLRYE